MERERCSLPLEEECEKGHEKKWVKRRKEKRSNLKNKKKMQKRKRKGLVQSWERFFEGFGLRIEKKDVMG